MSIQVVNCHYYNRDLKRYWAIDLRIDRSMKIEKKRFIHLQEILLIKAINRGAQFKTALMDTLYFMDVCYKIMSLIDVLGYKFLFAIRNNRLVLDNWSVPQKPTCVTV